MKQIASYALRRFGLLPLARHYRHSGRYTDHHAIPAAITTPDKVETRIGTLDFEDGMPSKRNRSPRSTTTSTSRMRSTRS